MGALWSEPATHAPVPDDVKAKIAPISYTPAATHEVGGVACADCGQPFGWIFKSTNCDWCGRQLCRQCCPTRHLLGDHPGCAVCTKRAFSIRRAAMLDEHHRRAGVSGRAASPAVVTGVVVPAAAPATEVPPPPSTNNDDDVDAGVQRE